VSVVHVEEASPPSAMRWTHELPSVAGRPWQKQRLEVREDGSATWESAAGGGDGDVDEELTPRPRAVIPPVVCRGRVAPEQHRSLVAAARKAMAAGCKQQGGRRVDEATTTMAVTWQGEISSCTLRRSGGSYALFEKERAAVVEELCRRR
jgi:hypothetical protein